MTAGKADRTKAAKSIPVSALAPQTELMQHDTDLEGLRLQLKGFGVQRIDNLIVSGNVARTIEGASTMTIAVNDYDRVLQRSRFLGAEVDILVDGLWFRLTDVRKNGDNKELVFEDREVAILRKKAKMLAKWGVMTRAQFVKRLIRKHVPELEIPILPAIKDKKQLTKPKDKDEKKKNRDFGLPNRDEPQHRTRDPDIKILTIKNVPATKEQLNNCERVLDQGVEMDCRRKILVASIMTIIQESRARNVVGGDKDSTGLFQQRSSQGWPASRNIEKDSAAFFKAAKLEDQKNPGEEVWELCANVQRPREDLRKEYNRWHAEGERIVTAYGIAGQTNYDEIALFSANLQNWEKFTGDTNSQDFQFYCGRQKGKKWKEESIWDCIGRLADEVNWRRFMVSGSLYFVDEPRLFGAKPFMTISEKTDGIDNIDFSYSTGKRNSEVTVTCRIHRWVAPPGSTVLIRDCGLINGKWLVSTVERNLFNTDATITLKKPRAKLPEPKQNEQQSEWPDLKLTPGTKKSNKNATPRYLFPITATAMPGSSGFSYVDAEGAPDHRGVRHHAAMDWMAPGGTPVFAPIAGRIIEVRQSRGNSGQIFGGVVKLQELGGRVWVFRHVRPTVQQGLPVAAGQQLATVVRWADNPSSSHTHIELWKTLSGGYNYENMLDPWAILGGT